MVQLSQGRKYSMFTVLCNPILCTSCHTLCWPKSGIKVYLNIKVEISYCRGCSLCIDIWLYLSFTHVWMLVRLRATWDLALCLRVAGVVAVSVKSLQFEALNGSANVMDRHVGYD